MVDRIAFAELHCHTNFSFLDGASAPDELVERAVALGLSGLAVTDHQGLVRRRPVRDGGRGGGAPPGHRRGDRARRRGRRGPGRAGRAGSPARPAPEPERARPCSGRWVRRVRPMAVARTSRRRAGPPVPARRGRACPATARRSRRTCGESARACAGRTSSCWPGTRPAIGASAGSSRGRTWPARRACPASRRRSSPSTPRG